MIHDHTSCYMTIHPGTFTKNPISGEPPRNCSRSVFSPFKTAFSLSGPWQAIFSLEIRWAGGPPESARKPLSPSKIAFSLPGLWQAIVGLEIRWAGGPPESALEGHFRLPTSLFPCPGCGKPFLAWKSVGRMCRLFPSRKILLKGLLVWRRPMFP